MYRSYDYKQSSVEGFNIMKVVRLRKRESTGGLIKSGRTESDRKLCFIVIAANKPPLHETISSRERIWPDSKKC